MQNTEDRLEERALQYAHKDFSLLNKNLTVREALELVRKEGLGEKIIYFYVVNDQKQVVGVIPTRRLLTSMPFTLLKDIMKTKVITLSSSTTVLEACEIFLSHKFLALPIINEEKKILGVIDISLLTKEHVDLAERKKVDDVFQWIGFRISQIKNISPLEVFKYRFPWLLATITAGIFSALLVSMYETTLTQTIMLAFFLMLVLSLGESISIQSMTITMQYLHINKPSWKKYRKAVQRELINSFLLGIVSGIIVGIVSWLWKDQILPSVVIGLGILLSMIVASLLGLSIPTFLHAIKKDPKIAAGPITLALVDVCTLFFYFNVALFILK